MTELKNQAGAQPGAHTENHLLVASGIMAIALTAGFVGQGYGFWPEILIFIAFALVFLILAYSDRLGLGEGVKRSGLGLMFALSALTWIATPMDISLILTVVMMAEAPTILNRRDTWLLMLVTNLSFIAVFFFYWEGAEVFGTWISMLALQAFAVTSSLARVEEAALKQQLFEQNAELVAARSALAQQSQMEERLRIAGDLHDSVGHQLTALRLQLEALAQTAGEELKPRIKASQQLSSDLLENIRSIVKRMSTAEDVALDKLIARIDEETPGVRVVLSGSVPAFQLELKQQLAPCIKEGVSNAIRHGGATEIQISVTESQLLIEDNGAGVEDGIDLGFGLQNLANRLLPFGGTIELTSRDPVGCRLKIELDRERSLGAPA